MAGFTLLLMIAAKRATVLFATTALFGLVTPFYGVARYTAISRVFPNNDGVAIGMTLGVGNLGNVVLPVVAATTEAVFMWQLGFGFLVPCFVLAGVLLWTVFPRSAVVKTNRETFSLCSVGHVLAELRRLAGLLTRTLLLLGSVI